MARKSELSRDQLKSMILDAAEAIVVQNGSGALKVRMIAMEIGCTVASIYLVFDHLTDVKLHLNLRTLNKLCDCLQDVNDEIPIEQRFHHLALCYLNFARQNFHLWQMLFEQSAFDQNAWPDGYIKQFHALFSLIERHFVRHNPTIATFELKQITKAYLSAVHGVCALGLFMAPDPEQSKDITVTMSLLIDHFIQGWLKSSQ